jgi:hypothetical protein
MSAFPVMAFSATVPQPTIASRNSVLRICSTRSTLAPCHSLICLGVAARRQIDGYCHDGTSRRLGTLQQLRGDVPSSLGNILDRRRRLRRENLQLPSRLGCARHGQLAFGMECRDEPSSGNG